LMALQLLIAAMLLFFARQSRDIDTKQSAI